MSLYDKRPQISTNTFVAPNASVIGEVKMFDGASVWYGAVVRGTAVRILRFVGTGERKRSALTRFFSLCWCRR